MAMHDITVELRHVGGTIQVVPIESHEAQTFPLNTPLSLAEVVSRITQGQLALLKPRIVTDAARASLSAAAKGRPLTDKQRAAVSNYQKATVTCPHCSKSGGRFGMNMYHFDKCKWNPTFKSDLTMPDAGSDFGVSTGGMISKPIPSRRSRGVRKAKR